MNKIGMILMVVMVSMLASLAEAGCPTADLTSDCRVDLADLSQLAAYWLDDNNPQTDNQNLTDFNQMSVQWLDEGEPEPDGMVWINIVNDPGISGHEGFNGEMSQYETTNAQYCQFLNAALVSGDISVSGNDVKGASGSNSGADFAGQVYYFLAGSGYTPDMGAIKGGAARINHSGGAFTVDSGFENHPVTYVSWYGASAFASYYGLKLPTEWEWQAVADFDGSYTYGCGPTIDKTKANYDVSSHYPNGTTLVGAFGTYGYGMADMAGNVHEWTSSLYIPGNNYRVIRGGSWDNSVNYCRVAQRSIISNDLSFTHYSVGFRVCRP